MHLGNAGRSYEGALHICRMDNPEQFGLDPVNSPAMLMHWRAMLLIIHWLVPPQRMEFRQKFDRHDEPEPATERVTGYDIRTSRTTGYESTFPSTEATRASSECEVDYSREMPLVELTDVGKAGPEVAEGEAVYPLYAFDSHFHLDRLQP